MMQHITMLQYMAYSLSREEGNSRVVGGYSSSSRGNNSSYKCMLPPTSWHGVSSPTLGNRSTSEAATQDWIAGSLYFSQAIAFRACPSVGPMWPRHCKSAVPYRS